MAVTCQRGTGAAVLLTSADTHARLGENKTATATATPYYYFKKKGVPR